MTTMDTGDLDRKLDRLQARASAWIDADIPRRIELLERCLRGVREVAADWVATACGWRGFSPGSAEAGEEWLSGPMTTARYLRLLIESLRAEGQRAPVALSSRDGDRFVADVFPADRVEGVVYYFMTAELWGRPGMAPSQGAIYRPGAERRPGVSLVLGAGNIASIGPFDFLHKLFVEDQVVLLKMNPVNDGLGPHLERAFAPLIEGGFLELAYGGGDVGDYLCRHARVESVHLTGAGTTFDAIVWGSDPAERERRRAAGDPRIDKPFTAELGSVTPIVVVPGRWSRGDLDFQAAHVAAMVAHNASFNCNAGKVLVVPDDWDRRDAFLQRVRVALAAAPPRRAYYPGAESRYRAFLDRYPQCEPLGRNGENVVPWTLIPDVPAAAGEYALENEAFCGVLAQVGLPGRDAAEFLERAVPFVNDDVRGTLSAVMLIDGKTRRRHAEAFDRAVEGLCYGGIGINVWTGVDFGLGVTSWGAFPGHSREAIGSGIGAVHNAYLFDHPERSVVRAPFRIWPKPVWFAGHRGLDRLAPRLTHYEAAPTPFRLAAVLAAGLRG